MLALYFGRLRHLSFSQGMKIIERLQELPDKVRQVLGANDQIRRIAEKYYQCSKFLYLGRQFNFPTALEGALKLKEISYIHAEGYPAAEMKHGPIALIDENTPSVFIIPHGVVYDKVIANMEEIKARGGPVIAVTCEVGATGGGIGGRRDHDSRRSRISSSPSSRPSRCNSWPITSRCCVAATSTSRATWPRASLSSSCSAAPQDSVRAR